MRTAIAAFLAVLALGSGVSAETPTEPSAEPTHKQIAIALLKSIETGDPLPFGFISPTKYIQHNPGISDGRAGFSAFVKQLQPTSATVTIVRAFQDGDHVFTHSAYHLFGQKIGFDIFRFEHGRVVEHWDNLQATAKPNPSGHTMIDGTTQVKDLGKTKANKALVKGYVEDVLVNGKMDKLAGYFDGDHYTQHSPEVPDRLSGLIRTWEEWRRHGVIVKYHRVHKVLGEGNFVLVVSEGHMAGRHHAFYDLFRVEQGKIAEHWDVIEEIPAKGTGKNSNGKF